MTANTLVWSDCQYVGMERSFIFQKVYSFIFLEKKELLQLLRKF